MDPFKIEIAGLCAQVHPIFLSTKEYCKAYLTDREPDIIIQVSQDDLVYEQMMADREADAEGLKRRIFTNPFLERATILRKFADELVKQNTILVHGSTVSVDGMAFLFTAPCGTGKSTHTRLWRTLFGQRAVMVNDDKTFLTITSSGVIAYGSPWSGKHGLHSNISVPLKGICILRRGQENVIRSIDCKLAASFLMHQSHIPDIPEGETQVSPLVDRLLSSTSLWEMECTMDLQAAQVSYCAMSGMDKI